jgi:DNA-binding LacI/PurR family transcriptional regulator
VIDANSPNPLYLQIARTLRERIASGTLRPLDRLPPEVELARDLEVSRGTIRQAFDILVQEGLLTRTQGKGTFISDHPGRATSGIIGVVVPYLRDTLVSEILRGAEGALHDGGYSMILSHSDSNVEREKNQLERILGKNAEGIILFPVADANEYNMVAELLPAGFPVVVIDRRLPGLRCDAVLSDNAGGARAAVRHLLSLGHSRIACITVPDRPSSVMDRIAGYEQAMQEAGLFPLAAVPIAGSGSPGAPSAAVPTYSEQELSPVDNLLAQDESPTAFFCVNDFLALGVLHHLRSRGVAIPEDVAIVGFDDIAMSSYPSVQLTTVAQAKHTIGLKAAVRLVERIGGDRSPAQDLLIPTELVVRTSCGAGLVGSAQ